MAGAYKVASRLLIAFLFAEIGIPQRYDVAD